jgi:dTDP-4-amino-4,6-dideoxygalactose transaminase
VEDLKSKITPKTKAIVVVHYGGLPCEMDEITEIADKYGIPVIEDAAHAVGAIYKGKPIGSISEFTMFSFQAIKHITTGDGGLLAIKDANKMEEAKRLRWFGIDRSAKQNGIWENDIKEIGYKYQMTDLGAALGIAGLEEFESTLKLRQSLLSRYIKNLSEFEKIKIIGAPNEHSEHAAWLFTILTKNRRNLQKYLLDNGVESNQVHYRNDRYSILGSRQNLPNMNLIEDDYLVLPLHTKMTSTDVDRISMLIKNYHDRSDKYSF